MSIFIGHLFLKKKMFNKCPKQNIFLYFLDRLFNFYFFFKVNLNISKFNSKIVVTVAHPYFYI